MMGLQHVQKLMVFGAVVCSFTAFFLITAWMNEYVGDGLVWNDANIFNFHPFFMVLGFVVCETNAIVLHSSLTIARPKRKMIHFLLHVFSITFATIGLYAIFESHRIQHKANVYSLHSWMGLMTVFCWSLQFIFGFAVYFFGSDASTKKQYSALHIKWGLFVFVLGCIAALLGILEFATFNSLQSGTVLHIANGAGIMIAMTLLCVIWIVTNYAQNFATGKNASDSLIQNEY